MIRLMTVDSTGDMPYPEASNLTVASLQGLPIMGGESLKGKFPPLTITLTDRNHAPPGIVDYFTVGRIHVVSSELKLVMERVGAEFEYFPVEVLYENVRTPINYFAANPLRLLRAVDLVRSDVELDPETGDCISVNEVVLDESAFKGTKIAAIAEIPYLGVQDEIARIIELSGCIGCVFVDPITVQY